MVKIFRLKCKSRHATNREFKNNIVTWVENKAKEIVSSNSPWGSGGKEIVSQKGN